MASDPGEAEETRDPEGLRAQAQELEGQNPGPTMHHLRKRLCLSVLQFPHLENGYRNSTYLIELS